MLLKWISYFDGLKDTLFLLCLMGSYPKGSVHNSCIQIFVKVSDFRAKIFQVEEVFTSWKHPQRVPCSRRKLNTFLFPRHPIWALFLLNMLVNKYIPALNKLNLVSWRSTGSGGRTPLFLSSTLNRSEWPVSRFFFQYFNLYSESTAR
jgi:hypothetical protein